jgi:hypothetical protein
MDREDLLRWILILCSKTLFMRVTTSEPVAEELVIPVGSEAWPGGDVGCSYTTQDPYVGSADAPAA